MDFPQFIGPTYQERSLNFDAQRCINWIPITGSNTSKTQMSLIETPGLELWTFLSANPIRGIKAVQNFLFVVAGNILYKILTNKTITNIGTLSTSTGLVGMEINENNELAIVDGIKLYVYNYSTNVFNEPSPQPLGGPTSIAFIDQYLVVTLSESQNFQISNLNDAQTWSAIQFAASESSPDLLIAAKVLHKQLYLFGEFTTEIWYDSGASPFPFDTTSGVIDWGVMSKESIANAADTLVWLGRRKNGSLSGQVVKANGYQAEVISTPALEARWRTYSTTTDAIAFSYWMDGGEFYVITFPAGKETFCYDFTTRLWHERSSFNLGYWRAIGFAPFAGAHLTGDLTTGKLYNINPSIFTDNGESIIRIRRAPHLWNDRKMVTYNSLQLEFESGPENGSSLSGAMLRWSNDGGHTWSNYYVQNIGSTGEYTKRVIWRRLGTARDRVFEVSFSDAVKARIIGASLEAKQGVY